MSRTYAQQKRPGAKAPEPSYSAPAVHAPSLVSGQSSSNLDALMQAKYRQHFLDNQIPTAEAEADRIAASVSGARTPEEVKSQLGEKMGADFSNVTFHTDSAALKQADAMGARAYTTGSDVYFGSGGFDPGVAAHELVHTVQQGMVGSTMTTTSAPTGGVQMKPFGLSTPKIAGRSRFFHRQFFGSYKDRSKVTAPNPDNLSYNAEDIAIPIVGNAADTLSGYKYTPRKAESSNGQSIIVFSGTSGDNFGQMQKMIEEYTKKGYTVYGADYRGFGRNNRGKKFRVSEAGLNEDAHNIYNYVTGSQGVDPNKLTLHGFSMGGAVASRLAADVSQRADGADSKKLGGLVLHSAMKDLEAAASDQVGAGSLGRWAGKKSVEKLGRFSTEDALESLSETDKELPLYMLSGDSRDRLALEYTKLDQKAAELGMEPKYAKQGTQGHLSDGMAPGSHLQDDFLNHYMKVDSERAKANKQGKGMLDQIKYGLARIFRRT